MNKKLAIVTIALFLLSLIVLPVYATATETYNSYTASLFDYAYYWKQHPSADTYLSAHGQAFEVGVSGFLLSAHVWLKHSVGTPNGDMIAHVYAGTGTYGTNMVPTGSAVAESNNTFELNAIPDIYTEYTFTFNATKWLTHEEKYCIAFEQYNVTTDVNNRVAIACNQGNPGGNGFHYDSSAWGQSGEDTVVVVYVSDTYGADPGDYESGWTPPYNPGYSYDDLITGFVAFIVPIVVILTPAAILMLITRRADKWLLIIGVTIGAGLGYYFALVPVWLVFLIVIGLIGMAYQSVKGGG